MIEAPFLNFGEVEAVSSLNYLNPGQYLLKPTKVELTTYGQNNTQALAITFEHEDGRSLTEKFVLQGKDTDATKKCLGRLQYLFEKLYQQPISETFKSYEALKTYFTSALLSKPRQLQMIVGGRESDGRVYACLPFAGFIYESEKPFTEMEYPADSSEYIKLVQRSKPAPQHNEVMLNTGTIGGGTKQPWDLM